MDVRQNKIPQINRKQLWLRTIIKTILTIQEQIQQNLIFRIQNGKKYYRKMFMKLRVKSIQNVLIPVNTRMKPALVSIIVQYAAILCFYPIHGLQADAAGLVFMNQLEQTVFDMKMIILME